MSRWRMVAVLAAGVAIGACGGDSTGPDQDPDPHALIGTWNVLTVDGVSRGGAWTLGADSIVVANGGGVYRGTYTFTETIAPFNMDIALTGFPLTQAIWDFPSPNSLRVKVEFGAGVRATNFNVETGYDLFTFSRAP